MRSIDYVSRLAITRKVKPRKFWLNHPLAKAKFFGGNEYQKKVTYGILFGVKPRRIIKSGMHWKLAWGHKWKPINVSG
jgi:hypothetical protein